VTNPTEILHLASQYLAAANLSFVTPKEDDSHSNLGWGAEGKRLFTYDLSEDGLRLVLNLNYYSLDFVHPTEGEVASYPLSGARHLDVVNWVVRECAFMKLKGDYNYHFHYELPYTAISDDFVFPSIETEVLEQLAIDRSIADRLFTNLGSELEAFSLPRIWPHHFDTGSLATFNNGSIGYGMAIPDSMVDDYYFYVAGYKGHDSIDTLALKPLKHGEWRSGSWNGAVIRNSENEKIVKEFLEEVTAIFKSQIEES
jgi:hypothetical protein